MSDDMLRKLFDKELHLKMQLLEVYDEQISFISHELAKSINDGDEELMLKMAALKDQMLKVKRRLKRKWGLNEG